ncbi:hypothetical protein AAG570_004079 [Ranatra chinensis]|uniref:Reverse transcriptase domain-containing protein n=1 Tax=Ranatra chinensis TaxID=642074 RepID=A0ABD0YPJ2_9HEMI
MNPSAPRLKALPKTHKPDIPIRPVIQHTTAPSQKIAKFISHLLNDKLPVNNPYSIKNSKDLIQKIASTNVNPHTKLVSFDIKDLYTSIPPHEIITILRNRLPNSFDSKTASEIIKISKVILSQNYFQFNRNLYQARKGLGMGNPTSAYFAELFLDEIEKTIVPTIKDKFNVASYYRYVDDTICIIEDADNTASDILNFLNSVHPNLTYTIESETDNKLNFLDLTIEKTGQKLDFSIFRKPSYPSTTIHKTSNHPTSQKQSAYRYLINRLQSYPLSPNNYKKELQIIYQTATENGFSRTDIDKLLNSNNNKKNKENPTTYASFTYVGPETHKITNTLRKYGITPAFKTNNKIQNYICPKPDQKVLDCSGVYKLQCNTCDLVYIGQTGRRLSDRYKEHLAAFKLNKLTSNYATHLINSNHEPGPPEKTLTLIRKGNKGTRLNVTENLEIYKHSRKNRILNDYINSEANVLFKQILAGKRKREPDDEGSQVQQNKRNKGHRKRNANEVGNMALPDPKRVKKEGNIKRYLCPIESVVL